MSEKFQERLAECERLLQTLQGTANRQERIQLLVEMRRLIKNLEESQKSEGSRD